MPEATRENRPDGETFEGVSGLLHFAGARNWSASLFPALVGTTLPFWLHPPGFSFKWFGAVEFLSATLLFHAGFSFLLAWFERGSTGRSPGSKFLFFSGVCLVSACLLGLHLNSGLHLNKSVHSGVFIVFGVSVVIAGALYLCPPLRLGRRVGGEIVLSEGLGMLPVLGAYIVQAGDLTRRVYLASIPLVVATGLWIWVEELATRIDDEKSGRKTMIIHFGPRFSGRVIVPFTLLLLYVSLFMGVLTASIPPPALAALLSAGLSWKILSVCRKDYLSPERMLGLRKTAFLTHLVICGSVAVSPLAENLV